VAGKNVILWNWERDERDRSDGKDQCHMTKEQGNPNFEVQKGSIGLRLRPPLPEKTIKCVHSRACRSHISLLQWIAPKTPPRPPMHFAYTCLDFGQSGRSSQSDQRDEKDERRAESLKCYIVKMLQGYSGRMARKPDDCGERGSRRCSRRMNGIGRMADGRRG
jgi:hypothetical protein